MTILKVHSSTPYASRAGEYYRRQRDAKLFHHTCPEAGCAAKFYVRSQLTAHMRKHTGEQPFKCLHCKYAAKQKYLLDKHNEKEHSIPLPSTRISRYKMRMSLGKSCAAKRITNYSGKLPTQRRERLVHRLDLYSRHANILALITEGHITKKEFYADKSAGYIKDYWCIYTLACPEHLHTVGNSRRKAEKTAHFINQIKNLHILFPTPEKLNEQLDSLKEDNKKNIARIDQSYNLYKKIFAPHPTPTICCANTNH